MAEAAVAIFLHTLEQVPWFAHLGKPTARDSMVVRLADWDDGPGPEASAVMAHDERLMAWHDALFAAAGEQVAEARLLWDRIAQRVVTLTADKVPYVDDEDAWYGPTACVGYAAHTAGLGGCSLLLGHLVSAELADMWGWYQAGHWPCGYASIPADASLGRLLVY